MQKGLLGVIVNDIYTHVKRTIAMNKIRHKYTSSCFVKHHQWSIKLWDDERRGTRCLYSESDFCQTISGLMVYDDLRTVELPDMVQSNIFGFSMYLGSRWSSRMAQRWFIKISVWFSSRKISVSVIVCGYFLFNSLLMFHVLLFTSSLCPIPAFYFPVHLCFIC